MIVWQMKRFYQKHDDKNNYYTNQKEEYILLGAYYAKKQQPKTLSQSKELMCLNLKQILFVEYQQIIPSY